MAHQIQPRPIRTERADRDPKYREWLKGQPCAVCCSDQGCDPAHTGSRGKGTGLKACDSDAIPLCWLCHKKAHAIGERRFLASGGIGIRQLRELRSDLRDRYRRWRK